MTIKEKRLEILTETSRIYSEIYNKGCPEECDCPACTKLLALGEQLLRLVNPRKILNDRIKGYDDATTEDYRKMKEQGIKDKDIAEVWGMTVNEMHLWKKEKGLVGMRAKRNP